jgi:hypothetical protein
VDGRESVPLHAKIVAGIGGHCKSIVGESGRFAERGIPVC